MKINLPLLVLYHWLLFDPHSYGQRLLKLEGSIPWNMHTIDDSSLGADGSKLTDVNRDGKMDLVVGWEEGGVTRLYLHPEKVHNKWDYVEVPSPDVEDAFAVDLDKDGFMDLVTFSEGQHRRITVHWAPSNWNDYFLSHKWQSEDFPETLGWTRWIFGRPYDMDGKNGIDLIVGSKDPDGTLGWLESPPNPRITADWEYHEISKAGWIMSIELQDMDSDGKADILITDRYGELKGLRWLKRPEDNQLKGLWKSRYIGLREGEPMFLNLFKMNNHSLPNIIVPDLTRGWEWFYPERGGWKNKLIPYPDGSGTRGKSVVVDDLNEDGALDLIASFEGANSLTGIVGLFNFLNDDAQPIAISGLSGVKYDFVVVIDLDGDRDLDVLTSEETSEDGSKRGLGVIWYENPHK